MSDNSADNLDIASETEQSFRDFALALLRKQLVPPDHFNGIDCIDCEEPIIKARLALGKYTCIHCQTLFERKQGEFKR